jgi:sensor histidine kinase YesM
VINKAQQVSAVRRNYFGMSVKAVGGVLLAALVLGLLESFRGWMATRNQGVFIPLPRLLINNVPWWMAWAALTPLVILAASRFPLDTALNRWRNGVYHFITVLILSSAHLSILGYAYFRLNGSHLPQKTASALIRDWHINFTVLNVMTYAMILGVYYTINNQRRYRETALESARLAASAAQMESSMTAARLHALRMELNPHFLFNSLNSISALIRRNDKDAATGMVASLAQLLRATLDRGSEPTMTLGEELELLQLYVDIEKVRFGSRLNFEVDVPPSLNNALVPTLALQPLVENAVRHGIASNKSGGTVAVRARRQNGSLLVDIQDTGPGVGFVGVQPREGVGMANTRDRLRQLYGLAAGITLLNAPAGGAVCRFWLPYRENENGQKAGGAG